MEIGLKVILKIGETEHTLTLNEVKMLSLVIDSILKKEVPVMPIFPTMPARPMPPPWRPYWEIAYCSDTATITYGS